MPNIQLLANLGLAETNACFAHCVWPEPEEFDVLASGGASVVHCPSCNMKLGSGAAPIAEYLERGVNVAHRGRRRGLEQSARRLGRAAAGGLAQSLPRRADRASRPLDLFEMATIGGARALGLDADIGSIEIGKYADLAVLDLRRAHAAGPEDVYTRLIYSARAADVRLVLVGGRIVVEDGRADGVRRGRRDRRRAETACSAARALPPDPARRRSYRGALRGVGRPSR